MDRRFDSQIKHADEQQMIKSGCQKIGCELKPNLWQNHKFKADDLGTPWHFAKTATFVLLDASSVIKLSYN